MKIFLKLLGGLTILATLLVLIYHIIYYHMGKEGYISMNEED